MIAHTKHTIAGNTAQQRILTLLDDLPPEGVAVAEQFMQFLHEVVQQGTSLREIGQPVAPRVFAHPVIGLPSASLLAWSNLAWAGYEGDALADSEALYADA